MAVHDYIKSGDFATEKHVPVIETVDTVKAGETFHVTLSVGKDIAHPNTVEHHIEWIKLYFVAEGTQLPLKLVKFPSTYMVMVQLQMKAQYMQFLKVHWQFP